MRSLVVVRGGDKSLHLQWWCDPKERAFDIALSYFGDNCEFWKDKVIISTPLREVNGKV